MPKRNLLDDAAAWAALVLADPLLAAEEHGAETNIFNADIGNFVFTLIIFGLVVYILGKFAWKPLLHVLNEREATIREALAAARREREEAERKLAEYCACLERAREEAAAIVAAGRRDEETARQRIREEARQEGEQMIARARREIQLATDTARKELHDEASELAVRVAARVLRKELAAADHRDLVAESLQEMQAEGPTRLN